MELDSKEEATDAEGEHVDDVEDAEAALDEDADCLQASLVLLLWCLWFFDFCSFNKQVCEQDLN